jgi:hypothetical protein
MRKPGTDGTLLEHYTNDDGTVDLHHFTKAEGAGGPTFTVTTDHFGKNPWSAAERKAEGTPKSFFYVDTADKEFFTGGAHHYAAKYPATKIYDARRDPEYHAERSWNVTDLIARLKTAGYHGMFYSLMFPTVAMWHPVDVQKVEPERAHQMARQQAPAGGIVVNMQKVGGGRFAPRVLGRIRDVCARLARTPDMDLHERAVREDHDDATNWLSLVDHYAENDEPVAEMMAREAARHRTDGKVPIVNLSPGNAHAVIQRLYKQMNPAGDALGIHVIHPEYATRLPSAPKVVVSHARPSGLHIHTDLTPENFHLFVPHLSDTARRFAVQGLAQHYDIAARPIKYKLARRTPEQGDKELPGSAQPAADVTRPLTIGELKKLEDDHNIAKTKRLSHRVKPADEALGDASTFTANKAHVGKFLEALTQKRLVGHALRSKLADPAVTDEAKVAYLSAHLAREGREFLDATQAGGAGEWYGDHVNDYEKVFSKIFGFAPGSPHMTLVKALTAASSGSQNPRTNALSTYRMLKEGAARNPDNPFLGIPAYDEASLRAWLSHPAHPRGADGRTHPSLGSPGNTPVDEQHPPLVQAEWYKQHVLPNRAELGGPGDDNVGYRGRPAVIVDRPGHPDHGKLIAYNVGDKEVLTPEGGSLYARHRKQKAARRVLLPDPDAAGNLRPKGWGTRGEQIENGLGRVQKLVRDLGVKGAADWLLTPQDDEEFRARLGYVPDRAQIGEAGKLPGMFALGPKFGAFALNLHGNDPDKAVAADRAKWLTADLWWSRSWNRFMGTMFGEVKDKKTGKLVTKAVEAPRGTTERRAMAEAARRAVQAAGLNNVAELQAVMWYYEQALWRQLGVKAARSYSFRDGAKAIEEAHAQHWTTDQLLEAARYAGQPSRDAREQAVSDLLNQSNQHTGVTNREPEGTGRAGG